MIVPRIGVSVALPDECGRELQDYRCSLGDESARDIPSHVTLVPPHEVDELELPGLRTHLRKAAEAHEPFTMALRGTGTFRPVSPVVFISLVSGISECELLAQDVRHGPLAVPTEFPFHPHVTIGHHLPDEVLDRAFAEMASFECEFTVESFWLYLHDAGRGWRKSREFPLG